MKQKEAEYLAEILKAYSEGKTIQFKTTCGWQNIDSDMLDEHWKYVFRIKPDTKLRPYKNAEEFLQAMKEHGPYIKGCFHEEVYSIPVSVGPNAIEYIIRNCLDGAVAGVIEYSQLINSIWQDGTHCGILED